MEPIQHKLPGVFDLIKQSLAFYKKNYKIFFQIAAVSTGFILLRDIIEAISGTDLPSTIILAVLGFVLAIANIFVTISTFKAIKEYDSGATPDVKTLFKDSRSIFWSYIWVAILTSLVVMGSSLPLIFPALILTEYLFFAVYALVVDNKKGVNALSQSLYYVRGNWWAVLWRGAVFACLLTLIGLVLAVTIFVIFVPAGLHFPTTHGQIESLVLSMKEFFTGLWGAALMLVISFLASAVLTPLNSFYYYLLYKNLKLRKPEPTPEVTFKKSNLWFKVLAGWGVVVSLLFMIVPILAGFNQARQKYSQAGTSLSENRDITASQSEVPIVIKNVQSLESIPYTNQKLGFSIKLPKGWVAADTGRGDSVVVHDKAQEGTGELDSNMTILSDKKLILKSEASFEAFSRVLVTAFPEAKNVVVGKKTIGSNTGYEISFTNTIDSQNLNVNYFIIPDSNATYLVLVMSQEGISKERMDMLLSSAATFTILK